MNTILLTPNAIDVNGQLELVPDQRIEALTPEASIQIEVSSQICCGAGEDILDFRQRVLKLFPSGSIQAELISDDYEKVILMYKGHLQYNDSNVQLSLYAENGMPTGIKFDKVILRTKVDLNNVRIYWKNYKM